MFKLALALALTTGASMQDASVERNQAWAEDLIFLLAELERLHPTPHHATSREAFEDALYATCDRVGELSDDQVVVEMMRLMGLHGSAGQEGHCGLWPGSTFGALPIQLYAFDEGWYIVAVDGPGLNELVGARVLSIEGTPIDGVVAAVAPLIARDNETDLLAKLPHRLRMPELLCALGVTASREAATFSLELPDGSQRDQLLNRVPTGMRALGLPGDPEVLWLTDAGTPWWTRVLEDPSALYVRFDVTLPDDGAGRSIETFSREVLEAFRAARAQRLVLDVRSNGGGNNRSFDALIAALRGDAAINRPGSLFCLMGRGTFSAGGNFVTVLEAETDVILVGEPTGGGPNQYGDAQTVRLPNHPELLLRVATRLHEFDPAHPTRLTHKPELAVPLSAADYFARRDPALSAALEFR